MTIPSSSHDSPRKEYIGLEIKSGFQYEVNANCSSPNHIKFDFVTVCFACLPYCWAILILIKKYEFLVSS